MTETERPAEVEPLVRRYYRRERPLSACLVLAIMGIYLAAYFSTSLLVSTGVALVLVLVARFPIYRVSGTIELQTTADERAVIERFTGPVPPVLGLQWGLADEITTDDGTVDYVVSYLFGLRSATMTVERTLGDGPDGETVVTLDVTENGKPWGTYDCTIGTDDEHTIVAVEYRSDRRFSIRRLPQQVMGMLYRDPVLEAQGLTVVDRESQFGL